MGNSFLFVGNKGELKMPKNISSKYATIFIIILIIVALLLIYNHRDNKQTTFTGDSSKLAKTVILPTLNTPFVPGKNNIWCSTFQLSWNEMKEKVIKEPIQVAGEELLCERLNSSKQKKTDLMEDSYFAAAGKKSEGIIEQIQNGMKSRFPSVEVTKFDDNGDFPEMLIAYSYLETYLKFKKPFRQNEEALLFVDSSGKESAVKSFGIWDGYQPRYEPVCEQIEVLHCKVDANYQLTEYALDLCKYTEPYQIVLAVMEPNETLESTYNSLQTKIKEFKDNSSYNYLSGFEVVDILKVPEMFWEISHHFSELEGKCLLNPPYSGWPIRMALQIINFRLDRSGAILKSQAAIAVTAKPREFIFNKPFLVYIKSRTSDQPFFVMWVDNAELLTSF